MLTSHRPPGSGKTKTIVAIVGALLTPGLQNNGMTIERPRDIANRRMDHSHGSLPAPKKLLVCAPSNAAVDELVMRFKEGVKTINGQHRRISVVRIGRSEAINANILDVTLDALVSARLGSDPKNGINQREETQKFMNEHQQVSEKLREARAKLDDGQAKGKEAIELKAEFDKLRRQKAILSTKIDEARDNENTTNRQADLNRKRAQQAILDGAHVICATLSGSGHEMFQNLNIEFETVVVDEAAQCVEMSALIPLKYGCAKCIMVGDPKQLPPTVFSKEAVRFQYEQSLFVRMQSNHPDDVHLLDTQYRMHPEISVFPSKAFYDGKLLDGGDMAILRQRPWHANALLGPYRFFDVQGQHQSASRGHSLVNIAEIEVALQIFQFLTTNFGDYDFKGKIGIITPYKSQLREMKDKFTRQYGRSIGETVEFNTTDAFQGRESEVIIFSCVRASPAGGIGFLQDIRRMNVGLTRAKSSLWVLGNSQSLVRGEFWGKLVHDARARDRYTEGNFMALMRSSSRVAVPNAPRVAQSERYEVKDRGFFNSRPANGIRNEEKSSSSSVITDGESNHQINVSRPLKENSRVGSECSVGILKRKGSFSSDEDTEMIDAPLDRVAKKELGGVTTTDRFDEDIKLPVPANAGSGVQKELKDKNASNPSQAAPPARPGIPVMRRKKEVNPLIMPKRPKKPKTG